MRRVLGVLTGLLLLGAALRSHAVESTWEYAVQVSAAVQSTPPQIRLSWPLDLDSPAAAYGVFRKTPGDASWGTGVRLSATATNYVDSKVQVGKVYEYQVVKYTRFYTSFGYICSGLEVPMTEDRGKLLLVVDKTYAAQLAGELTQLQQDLTGDGWRVCRFDVNRNDSVSKVKHLIQAQYQADPKAVKCVFLFGHVPVPYSGDIMPDGHDNGHQGAWPCDGYYGDMDGVWTDRTVNDNSATDLRNRNVPGDGKFDQDEFPAPLKLMVGRVDLANMPGREYWTGPATFPSELELLRNYLHKDHKFRTAQLNVPRRGLVGDYFGVHHGEAFAASGWRNLVPLCGSSNVWSLPNPGTWISTLSRAPYLLAYGCGPGTFESMQGIGNFDPQHHTGTTVELVRKDAKAAFVLLYGSWQGDWDAEDDLLRSVLALPSYGLACAWSGRPHWFLQSMGMGEPIGFGTRLTQNNGPKGLYQTEVNSSAGQIHVALMGDPTLRLHSVVPPTALTRTRTDTGTVLNWAPSSDAVLGYHVYRAAAPGGPYTRLTAEPLTGTSYTDTCPGDAPNYMVRAVKLETSASGTYFNLSQGAFPLPADQLHPLANAGAQHVETFAASPQANLFITAQPR
jgi:hypothetical protein